MVQKPQRLFDLLVALVGGVQTEGVPGEGVPPGGAFDVPDEDIVFKLRDFVCPDAGKAGLAVLEQVLGGETPGQKGEDGADQHHEGLVLHRLAGVVEEGQVVAPEGVFQLLPVLVLPPDDDGDVPGPKTFFPQEFPDGGGNVFALVENGPALTDGKVFSKPVIYFFLRDEEVLFEELKLRADIAAPAGKVDVLFVPDKDPDIALFGHFPEPASRLVDRSENHGGACLVLSVGADRAERDIDVFGLREDAAEKLQLLAGKALEPVDGKGVAPEELRVV